jgi:DNA-binding MarR family transcriptional regulator
MSEQAEALLAAEIERLFTVLATRQGGLGGEEPPSLTSTQRVALLAVVDAGALRLGALAERMATTDPTATRTVDSLAQLGLVERTPDPLDRRAIRVAATPLGRERVRSRRARLVELLRGPLARLDEDEQERVVELLRHLNDALAETGTASRRAPA